MFLFLSREWMSFIKTSASVLWETVRAVHRECILYFTGTGGRTRNATRISTQTKTFIPDFMTRQLSKSEVKYRNFLKKNPTLKDIIYYANSEQD